MVPPREGCVKVVVSLSVSLLSQPERETAKERTYPTFHHDDPAGKFRERKIASGRKTWTETKGGMTLVPKNHAT
jgi:hypothetical protein